MRGAAERLRPWLLPVCVLLGLSCFVFPIQNPDLWWHLSAGRWMAVHHALPRADFLSHTMEGAKWVDFEWGTQVLYYAVHAHLGSLGLLVMKLGILALILWTSLRLLSLYGLGPEARGLAALLLCTSMLPLCDLRPDNLSLLFFALVLLRLEARRLGRAPFTGRTYAAAAALFALWANLHLAFLYGLLLIGLYAAAESAETLQGGKSWEGLRGYVVFGAVSGAATLLNPYAGDLYGVLRRHHEELGHLTDVISEWQLPDVTVSLMRPFWTLLALAFSSALAHFVVTRRTPFHLLAALLYFGLSSSLYQRHITYLCLVALPVFFLTFSELARLRPALARRSPWGGAVLAGVLCFYTAPGLRGIWIGERDPLILEPVRPQADFLLKEAAVLGGKKLYNVWGDGGYLGWALYPAYRVFYDGRYIFHQQLFETQAALRGPDTWQAHLARYGVEVACMKRAKGVRQEKVRDKSGRARVLLRPYYTGYMPEKDWALVYWNETDLTFVRRASVPAAWLARKEYKLMKPGDTEVLDLMYREGGMSLDALAEELARHKEQMGGRLLPETDAATRWLKDLRAAKPVRKPGAP